MRASRAKVMTQRSTESFLKDMKLERTVRKNYAQLHNGDFTTWCATTPSTSLLRLLP